MGMRDIGKRERMHLGRDSMIEECGLCGKEIPITRRIL